MAAAAHQQLLTAWDSAWEGLSYVFPHFDAAVRTALVPPLQQLGDFWNHLGTHYHLPILIGHCALCVTSAPEATGNWLLHFIMTYILGFGGAALSSLLIQNPAKAPISLFYSNTIGCTWVAVWWLMTYSPLSGPISKLYNFEVAGRWPVKALSKACVLFFKARTVMTRTALATELFPGVIMAPLVLGTLAGTGGMCTFDTIRAAYGLSGGVPAEITLAGKSFRTAFLVCVLYLMFAELPADPLLSKGEVAAALTTLCVGHSLVSDITGWPLDWTAGLMRPVCVLARIPWPTASPKPLPKEPAQPAKPPAPQQPKPRQQQQQQQQPPAPQPKPPAPAPQRPVKAQAQPVQRKATPPTGAGAGAAPQAPPQQPNGRARSPTGRRNSAGEVDHPVPWSGRFAVLSSLEGGSPSSLKKRR